MIKINIIILMIFEHCLLTKIANWLDLGDVRQIILYFGLDT